MLCERTGPLYLACCGFDAAGAATLAAALDECRGITYLNLDGNAIGDQGVTSIAEAAERNPRITRLSLRGNGAGDIGAQAVTALLQRSSTLRELNFASLNLNSCTTPVSSAAAEALRTAILQNTHITGGYVHLSFTLEELNAVVQDSLKLDFDATCQVCASVSEKLCTRIFLLLIDSPVFFLPSSY